MRPEGHKACLSNREDKKQCNTNAHNGDRFHKTGDHEEIGLQSRCQLWMTCCSFQQLATQYGHSQGSSNGSGTNNDRDGDKDHASSPRLASFKVTVVLKLLVNIQDAFPRRPGQCGSSWAKT